MEPHRTLDKSHLARALTAESHLLRTVPLTKNSPTYPLPHLSFPIARGVPHPVHAYRACLTGASSWRILQLTPTSPTCASLDGSARCLRHSDAATLRPLRVGHASARRALGRRWLLPTGSASGLALGLNPPLATQGGPGSLARSLRIKPDQRRLRPAAAPRPYAAGHSPLCPVHATAVPACE